MPLTAPPTPLEDMVDRACRKYGANLCRVSRGQEVVGHVVLGHPKLEGAGVRPLIELAKVIVHLEPQRTDEQLARKRVTDASYKRRKRQRARGAA